MCSEYGNGVHVQAPQLQVNQSDFHTNLYFNNNHPPKQHLAAAVQTQSSGKQQQQQQHVFTCNKDINIECYRKQILDGSFDGSKLDDRLLIELLNQKLIPVHKLETYIGNPDRSVKVRRLYFEQKLRNKDDDGSRERAEGIKNLPHENFDYDRVVGACCENVIGYVQLPVGIAGPLLLDNEEVFVPMATTEGCLVASTTRGFSALSKSGGVTSHVAKNFMTRAPCVKLQNVREVEKAMQWLEDGKNKERLRFAFNSTSTYAKLEDYEIKRQGFLLYIRFRATTGDAMGMNMLSKGTERALEEMKKEFPTMEVSSLSSNYCTDKKPAAVNWINGRGKDVQCEATLPKEIVQSVLKVSVEKMVDLWRDKVMIGSALAGSIGGFNSQAANIVTALYIACGQDPAQNVTSSNCIITMSQDRENGSLVVHCTMPSIECGTVGGGTILTAQNAALQMMGINGSSKPPLKPGDNAEKFARIVCASVLAGELSLLAALAEGTLVKSHMRHNRSSLNVPGAAQKHTSAASSE